MHVLPSPGQQPSDDTRGTAMLRLLYYVESDVDIEDAFTHSVGQTHPIRSIVGLSRV